VEGEGREEAVDDHRGVNVLTTPSCRRRRKALRRKEKRKLVPTSVLGTASSRRTALSGDGEHREEEPVETATTDHLSD